MFCAQENDDSEFLFPEETIKNRRHILQQRNFHKHKYQNTVLPSDIFDFEAAEKSSLLEEAVDMPSK